MVIFIGAEIALIIYTAVVGANQFVASLEVVWVELTNATKFATQSRVRYWITSTHWDRFFLPDYNHEQLLQVSLLQAKRNVGDFNGLQLQFDCCGYQNPSEWNGIYDESCLANSTEPWDVSNILFLITFRFLCFSNALKIVKIQSKTLLFSQRHTSLFFQVGCSQALLNYFRDNAIVMAIVLGVVLLIEVSCIGDWRYIGYCIKSVLDTLRLSLQPSHSYTRKCTDELYVQARKLCGPSYRNTEYKHRVGCRI